MRRRPITVSARHARRAGVLIIAISAVGASLGWGSAAAQPGGSPAIVRARATRTQFPNAVLNAENVHCDAAQLAARQAPIVHRPASLPSTTRAPLLIALHGSSGDPQSMESLTHFVEVANEHGFVAVLPASCDLSSPWAAPEDFAYLTSLISQLKSNPNTAGANSPGPVDPTRVYVTGFSRGGFATWRLGCALSRQVAAIAVVSFAMNGVLYDTCNLAKPISELLIVGSADSSRYTGVPGKTPSAAQTTALWRSLDGCSAQVATQQPISAVTQQLWGNCVDGSSVGLYTIFGAGHVWPPSGPGAPANYIASEVVWAFLSSHRSAPTTLTRTDVSLRSIRATRPRAGRLVAVTLRVSEPLTIAGRLLFRGRPVAHSRLIIRAASPAPVMMTFRLRRGASSGRYSAALDVTDAYGRHRTLHRSVTVPSAHRR